MKSRRQILISLFLLLLVFSCFFVIFKVPLGNDSDYFKDLECNHSSNEAAVNSKKSIVEFYQNDSTINRSLFLKDIFICHPVGFQNDFDSLELIYNNERLAEDTLTEILTKNLFEQKLNDFDGFKPNELMKYLVFAERLSVQNLDKKYKYFLQGITHYWFNKVSNKLTELVEEDSDIRFNPMYRVLVSRCAQNKYHIALEFTAIEKVISYFIEGKYSYVWGRIWLRTSVFQKFIIVSGIIVTIVFYILAINSIILYIKSKIKKS